MRVTALEINARLENVTNLTVGDDYQFFMKCDNCRDETEKEMAFGLEGKVSYKSTILDRICGQKWYQNVQQDIFWTPGTLLNSLVPLLPKSYPKWLIYNPLEADVPIPNGKANVNLSFKCKGCGRISTVAVIEGSLRKYTADDSNNYKSFIEMDCRGATPISFLPLSHFTCNHVDNNRKFTEVDISEDDWADYDETSDQTVGVYEFKYQFKIYKK